MEAFFLLEFKDSRKQCIRIDAKSKKIVEMKRNRFSLIIWHRRCKSLVLFRPKYLPPWKSKKNWHLIEYILIRPTNSHGLCMILAHLVCDHALTYLLPNVMQLYYFSLLSFNYSRNSRLQCFFSINGTLFPDSKCGISSSLTPTKAFSCNLALSKTLGSRGDTTFTQFSRK